MAPVIIVIIIGLLLAPASCQDILATPRFGLPNVPPSKLERPKMLKIRGGVEASESDSTPAGISSTASSGATGGGYSSGSKSFGGGGFSNGGFGSGGFSSRGFGGVGGSRSRSGGRSGRLFI